MNRFYYTTNSLSSKIFSLTSLPLTFFLTHAIVELCINLKGSEFLNKRIKELRNNEKLTLKKFGDRLGVSEGAISNLEKGKRNLTEQMLKAICREFNVNEEWLRNGSGEMYIKNTTFNLDEYAKSRGATSLEIELIKSYLKIPKEVRESVLDSFKKTLSSHPDTPCSFSEEKDGQILCTFGNNATNIGNNYLDTAKEDYIKNNLNSASTMTSTALNTTEKEKYVQEIEKTLEPEKRLSVLQNSKNA